MIWFEMSNGDLHCGCIMALLVEQCVALVAKESIAPWAYSTRRPQQPFHAANTMSYVASMHTVAATRDG